MIFHLHFPNLKDKDRKIKHMNHTKRNYFSNSDSNSRKKIWKRITNSKDSRQKWGTQVDRAVANVENRRGAFR